MTTKEAYDKGVADILQMVLKQFEEPAPNGSDARQWLKFISENISSNKYYDPPKEEDIHLPLWENDPENRD